MVSAARKISHQVGPVEALDPILSVLPPGEVLLPWTDSVIDGFYGRIAIRETRGAGLPLVLIHGNSVSKDVFVRQMAGALGARYRMIAIDLPGHGGSDDAADPRSGYTLTGYADAVVDVIERLGLDRYALFGWSLGGHVALEIAASAPGVAGVMITGTPPIGTSFDAVMGAFRPNPLVALVSQVEIGDSDREAFADLIGIGGDPALVAAVQRTDGRARGRVIEDVMTGGATDERAIVANLGVPLAIVNGAEDPIVDLAYVQGLTYASLWEDRFHTFPYAGHAPFLSAPDLFNATLARFMHDLERNAGHDMPTPGLCLGG